MGKAKQGVRRFWGWGGGLAKASGIPFELQGESLTTVQLASFAFHTI